jgi:LDH2 family malate/lactate/ureidoglycolate dehydrogenase
MMQNGHPSMALPGATKPGIGNNPLSFAAPLRGRPPVVFDMAASEAAFGKIMEAAARGTPLPEGWALDEKGSPTRDAAVALTGMLLPVSGPKGIGLAMLVETLAGALTETDPAKNRERTDCRLHSVGFYWSSTPSASCRENGSITTWKDA